MVSTLSGNKIPFVMLPLVSKPNNAGPFSKRFMIDGVATGITTYWSGGEAPSSAETTGLVLM